jgi:hypothetical protein
MIIDAIQTLAQLLTKSSQFPNGQSDRQASYQIQLTPGQQVQAELMASLPNQRYLARIAGKLFNIELPIIVQPGETLQLTYVTGEPNMTFAMSRAGNSSTPVTISDTGKLLNQISLGTADPRPAGTLNRGGPVLTGTPADTPVFAKLLGEALSFNGIFYESHLLQWYSGERTLKDILREPQGRLSKRSKSSTEGERGGKTAADPGEEPGEAMILDELLSAGAKDGPVDPRTLPIIQEQMEALQSGQVVWRGEVWPKQEMEWKVQEDKGRNGEGVDRSWLSTVSLELPRLGRVEAFLRLGRDGLSIQIKTDGMETSSMMQKEEPALEEALSGAGIKLNSLAVIHEEQGK